MSATSREARIASAVRRLFVRRDQREPVERAGHRAHRLRCDLRVKGGGVECGMTEQHLDDADIDAILEQVRGEAVAQGVRSDTLVDIRGLGCLDDDPIEPARADRTRSARAREEQAIGHYARTTLVESKRVACS